jgi:hypothetical protein
MVPQHSNEIYSIASPRAILTLKKKIISGFSGTRPADRRARNC